jgi:hypothetical protein
MKWLWMGLGALIAVPLVSIPVYLVGSAQGKQAVKNALVKERLVTKEQISEIDNLVFDADESALCDILGGC